jgi:hypothetical protein
MRRMTRLLAGVVVLVLLGGAAVSTAAPVFLGPNMRVSGPAGTVDEFRPAAAWNGKADRYLIVWEDGRNQATRGTDIYGQLVGVDGVRVGANFRISNGAATSDEIGPAVAWSDSGGAYLVVWGDERNWAPATGGADIYGQLVGPEGELAGSNFRVSGAAATSASWPAVAANPADNEYLIVWEDGRNQATRARDIFGQRLATAGSPIGGDFRISGTQATENENSPAVAWNQGTDEYLVVWSDGRDNATRGHDIYGQRLNADGTPARGDFRISGAAATYSEDSPAVTSNQATDEYLVVWSDGRNNATRGWDIYGQRREAGGTRVGPNFRISGPAGKADDYKPALAWDDAAEQYLVVWEDERHFTTRGCDIYGQRLWANGELAGWNLRVSRRAATFNEHSPAVAWNQSAHEYLVVWEDHRNAATRGWDIYEQRLTG